MSEVRIRSAGAVCGVKPSDIKHPTSRHRTTVNGQLTTSGSRQIMDPPYSARLNLFTAPPSRRMMLRYSQGRCYAHIQTCNADVGDALCVPELGRCFCAAATCCALSPDRQCCRIQGGFSMALGEAAGR